MLIVYGAVALTVFGIASLTQHSADGSKDPAGTAVTAKADRNQADSCGRRIQEQLGAAGALKPIIMVRGSNGARVDRAAEPAKSRENGRVPFLFVVFCVVLRVMFRGLVSMMGRV